MRKYVCGGYAETVHVNTAAAQAARAGQAAADPPAGALAPALGETGAAPPDLTWLLHRAAQRMRAALDEVARAHGLAGVRDWVVLAAIDAGPRQTQLALGRSLGVDKTTLTLLLDRLETTGLVARGLDSHDRRARIPLLTEAGRKVQREVAATRHRAEAELLATFTAQEQSLLRDLLTRLAAGQPGGCTNAAGSCI
jgi:MarR family transcriptional regulator, organic hydroperoxide resistance regulator